MRRIGILLLFVVAVVLAHSQTKPDAFRIPKDGVHPRGGFVASAEVAQAVAEAVLSPVYGKQTLTSELPFKTTLKGGIWIVKGSVPCESQPGAVCPGGAGEVWISKRTGQILYMTHDQ